MTIDGSSRASELARATAHHIQSNGYLVLEKGVSAERVADLLHMSRSAVHSSLIRLGKGGNDKGLLRNLAEHWLDPERTGATRELARLDTLRDCPNWTFEQDGAADKPDPRDGAGFRPVDESPTGQ